LLNPFLPLHQLLNLFFHLSHIITKGNSVNLEHFHLFIEISKLDFLGIPGRIRTASQLITHQEQNNQPSPLFVLTSYNCLGFYGLKDITNSSSYRLFLGVYYTITIQSRTNHISQSSDNGLLPVTTIPDTSGFPECLAKA
jgi:hypothetical protein